MGSGVKRRVIETLSNFGICHSYGKANKVLHTVSNAARVRFRGCVTRRPRLLLVEVVPVVEVYLTGLT